MAVYSQEAKVIYSVRYSLLVAGVYVSPMWGIHLLGLG
jgi:hypothetical protein